MQQVYGGCITLTHFFGSIHLFFNQSLIISPTHTHLGKNAPYKPWSKVFPTWPHMMGALCNRPCLKYWRGQNQRNFCKIIRGSSRYLLHNGICSNKTKFKLHGTSSATTARIATARGLLRWWAAALLIPTSFPSSAPAMANKKPSTFAMQAQSKALVQLGERRLRQ